MSFEVHGIQTIPPYATWNPYDKGPNIVVSGNNLTAGNSISGWNSVRATIGKSSGKWYCEITIPTGNSDPNSFMIGTVNHDIMTNHLYANSQGACVQVDQVLTNTSNGVTNNGSGFYTFANGDIVGIALNMTNGNLDLYRNNTIMSPSPIFSGLTGTHYPACSFNSAVGLTLVANFGASAFSYSPPAGFNPGVYN
jgi:hypothetical protein